MRRWNMCNTVRSFSTLPHLRMSEQRVSQAVTDWKNGHWGWRRGVVVIAAPTTNEMSQQRWRHHRGWHQLASANHNYRRTTD